MSRTLNRLLLIGFVAILLTFGVTKGYQVIQAKAKTNLEIGDPVRTLPARLAAAESSGLVIVPVSVELIGTRPAPLTQLQNSFRADPKRFYAVRVFDGSLADFAVAVEQDAGLRQMIDASRTIRESFSVIDLSPTAILKSADHQAERFVCRALAGQAVNAARTGDADRMAELLTQAMTMNQAMAQQYDEATIIAWFSNVKVITQAVHDVLHLPELTSEVCAALVRTTASWQSGPDFNEYLRRDIAQLLRATEGIDTFSEIEIEELNANDLNDGPPDPRAGMNDAMKSQVLAFWNDVVAKSIATHESPEMIGTEIDRATSKLQDDPNPSLYMIRTLPRTYEQLGRTIVRGRQLISVSQAGSLWRAHEFATGDLNPIMPENGPTGVEAVWNGPFFEIAAANPGATFREPMKRMIDVDQQVGVRLALRRVRLKS